MAQLTHCATRREVPGSVPDESPWTFSNGLLLFSALKALGPMQPLPRNFFEGKVRSARRAGCAECQSRNGSPTFHPSSDST